MVSSVTKNKTKMLFTQNKIPTRYLYVRSAYDMKSNNLFSGLFITSHFVATLKVTNSTEISVLPATITVLIYQITFD